MCVCLCIQGRFTTEQIDYYGKACNASEGKKRFVVDIVIFGRVSERISCGYLVFFDVTNIIGKKNHNNVRKNKSYTKLNKNPKIGSIYRLRHYNIIL